MEKIARKVSREILTKKEPLSALFFIVLADYDTMINVASAIFVLLTTSYRYAFAFTIQSTAHPTKRTRLFEQQANIKDILGPVSPATVQSYNLPPSELTEGWSARIVTRIAKSLDESTDIELIPKNEKDHYVDKFSIEIPLLINEGQTGLGIELVEVQGGRDDGLGVVIVNSVIPGGNADRALKNANDQCETLMYGDSIVAADLLLSIRDNKGDRTDVTSVKTECLGYTAMVDQLVELLSNTNEHDKIDSATIILTLKRLRRRPKINIRLEYPPSQNLPPETIALQPGDNLRLAMLQRGIKLNDPLAQRYDGKPTGSGNCGSGGLCRTCSVSVLRGGELLSPPKANEKKIMEGSPRWRLACKSWVGYGMQEGEVVIQVNPRQW
ncbi:hypothetical protein ACHAWO_008382 [Cyclotella atomus]|uniref:PDZ domain-containing protein n=1 Tax=Cyclotella atomus TaxID=382360 RepID=A0ABD3NTM0_9STRA